MAVLDTASGPQSPEIVLERKVKSVNDEQVLQHALNMDSLLANLKMKLPGTAFKEIKESQMKGWYVVKMEQGNTAYITENGQFLLIGVVLDLDKRMFIDQVLDGKQ